MKKKISILTVLIGSFLANIKRVLAADPTPTPGPITIKISPPEQVKITDFGKLFSGAVGFLLLIAFIASFIFLVIGGLSWVTSGGDKAQVEAARNKILAAILGLIVVAASWALFQLVGNVIGFNIFDAGGFNVPRLY